MPDVRRVAAVVRDLPFSARHLFLPILLVAAAGSDAFADDGPWRLEDALGKGAFALGLHHYTRYENLQDQYRAGLSGDDQLLAVHTEVDARLAIAAARFQLELLDARTYLADDDTPLTTAFTNPIDILQATAGFELSDVLRTGDTLVVKAGRYTMDIGSRRFVARNRYRNTINAFTGIDAVYTPSEDVELHTFATLPVIRRPSTRAALADNEIDFDTESFDRIFWGFVATDRRFVDRIELAGSLYGLHDRRGLGRDYVTPAIRARRPPKAGEGHFELEVAGQIGTVAAEDRDLTHLALFFHFSAGYTAPLPGTPRLTLLYDYASGDADPNDDRSGRFDTLFGIPRGDFGPTMLYAAFNRANLSSPGARASVRPLGDLDFTLTYRAFALAEAADAWIGSGYRDTTGTSGTFLGHQIEGRARWGLLPKNVDLEAGFAHLVRRGFAVRAANGDAPNPTIVFVQLSLTI